MSFIAIISNQCSSIPINSNQIHLFQSNLIRFHQAFFRSHQVQSAFRDALISAKFRGLYLFLDPSIIWTSADSAGRRESHVRGLREAASSHGKEAGAWGLSAAPGKEAGVRGRQPLGKAGVRGRQPLGKAGVRGRQPPGIRLVLLSPCCGLLSRSSLGIPLIPCRWGVHPVSCPPRW